MMLEPTQQKFSIHMVKNSKPVGKFFKKKKDPKDPDGVGSSYSSETKKSGIKQNETKNNIVKQIEPIKDVKKQSNEQKIKKKHPLMKTVSGDSVNLGKPPNGQSKPGKWQIEKPSNSVSLKKQAKEASKKKPKETPQEKEKSDLKSQDVKSTTSNPKLATKKQQENERSKLPTSKRKFDDINTTSSNPKLPKKKKSSATSGVNENQKSSPVAASNVAKTVEDGTPQPSKKKRRKKKKKKVPNAEDSTDNTYKPVVIYKGKQDVSANWKNLKEMIIENDKKEAAKLMEKEDNRKPFRSKEVYARFKKPEGNTGTDTKMNKKRIKLTLEEIMEEQERQTVKYDEEIQKKNGTYIVKSKKKTKMDEIWFDNVDPVLLGKEYNDEEEENKEKKKEATLGNQDKDQEGAELDKMAVAIDCEMVGVGMDGSESILARVSIVDQYCKVLYDKFVKPQETVVDYRTEFSGIRPEDIKDGEDFTKVQGEVAKILDGKILVGHGLTNDLRVLFINHPRSRVRDSSRFKLFKRMCNGNIPKLKTLTKMILGGDIQTGEHDSVQDAQAAMRLYTAYRQEWDKLKKKVYDKPPKPKTKTKVVPDK